MKKIKVPGYSPAIERSKQAVVQVSLLGSNPKQDIKAQISELDYQIRQLRFKRAVLLSELRAKKNPKNIGRKFQLYALRLEDNCWYIGSSWNPKTRFIKHKKGKGALWTRLHKPIEIVELRDTGTVFQDDAHLLEDDMTLEYALKYGSTFVRGGGYCQRTKVHWPDVIIQNELPAL